MDNPSGFLLDNYTFRMTAPDLFFALCENLVMKTFLLTIYSNYDGIRYLLNPIRAQLHGEERIE